MAKLVVLNEKDPGIGIVLRDLGLSGGWTGNCTQCGEPVTAYGVSLAFQRAQRHVDTHPARI